MICGSYGVKMYVAALEYMPWRATSHSVSQKKKVLLGFNPIAPNVDICRRAVRFSTAYCRRKSP